jgi:hypothetical protein
VVEAAGGRRHLPLGGVKAGVTPRGGGFRLALAIKGSVPGDRGQSIDAHACFDWTLSLLKGTRHQVARSVLDRGRLTVAEALVRRYGYGGFLDDDRAARPFRTARRPTSQ